MASNHPHFYGAEGFWRGWIAVTRSGVFPYMVEDSEGNRTTAFWERSPEDVFSDAHLQSLIGVPIVARSHTKPLTSVNVLESEKPVVGAILSQFKRPIDEHGNLAHGYLYAKAVLWDQASIELARNGHGQVSEGYSFDLVERDGEAIDVGDSGEWNVARKVTGKMTALTANHVTVLDSEEQGRAGKQAVVVFDSESSPAIAFDSESELQADEDNSTSLVVDEQVEVDDSTSDEDISAIAGDLLIAEDSLEIPSDSDGSLTIDNSADPVYKMLKLVSAASRVAGWLYIDPNVELTLGNVARMVIEAINYSADLPDNDDMAIMKAELLIETIGNAWDSEDVAVQVLQVGDTNHGTLKLSAKTKPAPSTTDAAIAAPTEKPTPANHTLTPLPSLQRMANDTRFATIPQKTDRTSSLRKGWK